MTTQMEIESVPMPVKQTRPERKPRTNKPKIKVPESLRNAADDYKDAYRSLYGMKPTLTYDGTWVRLTGHTEGITMKRLKELTRQLRNRKG